MARKNGSSHPAAAARPRALPRQRNAVRIIAGQWRGRRISFAPLDEVRPTPDRVRETLFNWLQAEVAGSRCLDLFAGSGVLGIEALSRGAREVVFVDKAPAVIQQLRDNLAMLNAQGAQVVHADALAYLRSPAQAFDIIFLDPPFASDLRADTLKTLAAGGWLAPGALIYIEQPARAAVDEMPEAWTVLRSKRAGEVGYHLLRSSP